MVAMLYAILYLAVMSEVNSQLGECITLSVYYCVTTPFTNQ